MGWPLMLAGSACPFHTVPDTSPNCTGPRRPPMNPSAARAGRKASTSTAMTASTNNSSNRLRISFIVRGNSGSGFFEAQRGVHQADALGTARGKFTDAHRTLRRQGFHPAHQGIETGGLEMHAHLV